MLHVDQNIFWTVVNLLILFILLRIFLFKPVLGMIEKRKAAIEGTLSDADQKMRLRRHSSSSMNPP